MGIDRLLDLKRLKQKRKEAGYTQEQAAEQLGLDKSGISRLERGQMLDVTLDRLHDLASLYKTNLSEFLKPEALGGSPVRPAVLIPRLTAGIVQATGPDGLGSVLTHWRGATEVVSERMTGCFAMEAPQEEKGGRAVPAGSVLVCDPSDRKPVEDGLYLLLYEGELLTRRFLNDKRRGQFIAPATVVGEITRPIFVEDRPEVLARIVATMQLHEPKQG